jgi:glycerol-3-phosphate dehydrogenase
VAGEANAVFSQAQVLRGLPPRKDGKGWHRSRERHVGRAVSVNNMRQRSQVIEEIRATTYDVCVIGGGASGAGCALDAQLRGLKTVLVDSGDFGSATSSASTKLIHGGLRYLQQAVTEFDIGQYRFVRRALRERLLMLQNAPHLTSVLQFVIPCFSFGEALYYYLGLKMYDWLSGNAVLSRSSFASRARTLARLPNFSSRGLFGAVLYGDGQFDDARYNLALIQSCAACGGAPLNYAAVVDFRRDEQGRLVAAMVEDRESRERFLIRASIFVNATGPFSDVVRQMAFRGVDMRLKLSRGVHILLPLPEEFGNEAILIPKTEDNRVIFAIPWQRRLLVGTTEVESTLEEERMVSDTEAEYLLRHLNRYFVKPFDRSDIVSAMVGLRPLVQSAKSTDTKKMIRDYEIETDPRSGLISVLGGKWTVYRAMAEEAINAVEHRLTKRITACPTPHYRLFGFEDNRVRAMQQLARTHAVPDDIISHLVEKFGRCAGQVLELVQADPLLGSRLVPGTPQIRAEVVYSVREEMARSIEDILCRRLGLQFFDWRLAIQAAPLVGSILAGELGWTRRRTEEEVKRYVDLILGSSCALGLDLAHAGNAS